jgi:hypothetical protein
MFVRINRYEEGETGDAIAVIPSRVADFGAFIASEIVRWTADVKAAGIEPQ